MTVADSLCVGLIVLLVGICVALRLGNAVAVMMVVLPVRDRSTKMRRLMRDGCGRGHREHDGRGKHEKHGLEFAQNRHGVWDNVAFSGRQGVRSKRQTWRAAGLSTDCS